MEKEPATPAPPSPSRGRTVARLVVLVLSLAVAFAAAEVALRLHYRRPFRGPRDSWHEHDPRLGWRNRRSTVATPSPPAVARPFEVRLNGWGLRDERELADAPPAGRLRVACLGDSFTFGYCVEATDAFPRRLERALAPRLEVLNYGVCGHGVDQMRLLLDEALEKRPGLVLLCLIGDDLKRAQRAAFATTGEPKPLFVLQPSGDLVLTGVPVPRLAPGDKVVRVDAQGSFVAWKLRDAWARLRSGLSKGESEEDTRFALARAIVRDAARAAHAGKARFAVVYLPTAAGLAQGDPLARRVATLEADGIPVLDVGPAFAARLAETKGLGLFVPDDGHPSEEGHAIIADALARFLAERKLVP